MYDRGEYSTFDRDFDFSEARRIGFKESLDHVKGYHVAFDRMRAAKIIPLSRLNDGHFSLPGEGTPLNLYIIQESGGYYCFK